MFILITLASAFKIEMKLTPEQVMETNQSYMINSWKTKLVKFSDERGFSMAATESIKRHEPILAVYETMCPTSFDRYVWYSLFEELGHEV